jgi:RimJ/RimL family protein N-acetyltransferase
MNEYLSSELARLRGQQVERAAQDVWSLRRSPAGVSAPFIGGTSLLRPLRPGEVEPLREVFEGMSARSRADRYLVPVARLSGAMERALTALDSRRHVAWLATVDGRAAGIARFVEVQPRTAEIALEVVDEWQGRGLGGVLVDAVTTVASATGIRRLRASLSSDNTRSLRLLTRVGLRARAVQGGLEAEGPLLLPDPARIDRGAVRALAGLRAGSPRP